MKRLFDATDLMLGVVSLALVGTIAAAVVHTVTLRGPRLEVVTLDPVIVKAERLAGPLTKAPAAQPQRKS